METDTGDDVGNVMWMREKWRELVGKMYGSDDKKPVPNVPEGMDDVVEEMKQVQAARAKSEHPFLSRTSSFDVLLDLGARTGRISGRSTCAHTMGRVSFLVHVQQSDGEARSRTCTAAPSKPRRL